MFPTREMAASCKVEINHLKKFNAYFLENENFKCKISLTSINFHSKYMAIEVLGYASMANPATPPPIA